MRMANKIALVTGGSGGIGSAVAQRLAEEGATLIVTDLNDEAGHAIAEAIGGAYLRHDVADLCEWQNVVAQVIDQHGRIDALCHCAGIEGSFDGLATSEEDWNRVISINLTGPFLGCKTVVPEMLKAGEGSVILFSSAASYMATGAGIAYGAAKAGVQHLARSVASIGAKDGARVRCNSVHPGAIDTRMSSNIITIHARKAGMSEDAFKAAVRKAIPLGDYGAPEDIANMVLYLASDESRYTTGADFRVDGGWTMKDTS